MAFWDQNAGKVGEVQVKVDFQYEFTKRDYKGRLMVFDFELAVVNRHQIYCRGLRSGGDEGEEESKPFQGARSKP